MRKYGKYEKLPEPKAVFPRRAKQEEGKQPQVKSIMLQTYFTSLFCLVLCVTMFFGTTYAWFTSEVNNTANELYVGSLKAQLLKETASGVQDLATGDTTLFNKEISWEPGYTTVETIRVVNKGDLAFKYEMTFTDGALENGSGVTLAEVAGHFDVWVFDHENKTYTAPDSYEAITTSADWVKVGTLADVLNGTKVLSGSMAASGESQGTTNGAGQYTIALHMNELAGAQFMNQKISLNVKLVAYQLAYENTGATN